MGILYILYYRRTLRAKQSPDIHGSNIHGPIFVKDSEFLQMKCMLPIKGLLLQDGMPLKNKAVFQCCTQTAQYL